ncbi:MAG: hypothetical protein PCFJNLEI_01162 [Verrucomicrobiae bacterium]|nr:hypothetical protein [Verrucomicrobiae bacterium]
MRSCPLANRCGQDECVRPTARENPPELETRLYCLTGDCDHCPLLAEINLLAGGTFPEAERAHNGHLPAVPRTAKRTADESDLALIARAQAGDDAAYEELMARYQHVVWQCAYRVLGDVEEAHDTTQQVFVRVYRKLDAFDAAKAPPDAQNPFAGWLLTVAHHAAYDRRRWLNRRPTEPLSALLTSPPVAADDVVTEVTAHEIGERLAEALAEIPVQQKTALELCEVHGLSYAEAASVMHCTTKSVEARLYRGKHLLRKRLRLLWD